MPVRAPRRMTSLLIQVTNALARSGAAMAPVPVLLDEHWGEPELERRHTNRHDFGWSGGMPAGSPIEKGRQCVSLFTRC